MKPIAISSCLALAALSLYAADPQTSKETVAQNPPARVQALSSSPQSGVVDSPLVRAAKATGRLNKKPTHVITNETLVHLGGHFTTPSSDAQATLPSGHNPQEQTLDQMYAAAQKSKAEAAAAAEKSRKSAEQRQVLAERAAAQAEGDTAEGLYVDPPVVLSPTPQTMQPASVGTMGKPPL
jgi:hypothetical protein